MPELAYQTLEAPFGAFLFFKRFYLNTTPPKIPTPPKKKELI